MAPPNAENKLMKAPFADIVTILLTQFKRLLDERGLSLTKAQINGLGTSAERKQFHDIEQSNTIRALLIELLEESLAILRDQFGFTFAQSIQADMSDVAGWETTADFLERANQKSNAELRISAGASLLVALGDMRYSDILLTVIAVDAGAKDIDATLAIRVLSHMTGIPLDTEISDWRSAYAIWRQAQTHENE